MTDKIDRTVLAIRIYLAHYPANTLSVVWIIAGVKRNSMFDYITAAGATLGVAIPNFWLGLMLIIIFAIPIAALPVFGLKTWQGYILPAVVMTTGQTAVLTRVMRSSVIEPV